VSRKSGPERVDPEAVFKRDKARACEEAGKCVDAKLYSRRRVQVRVPREIEADIERLGRELGIDGKAVLKCAVDLLSASVAAGSKETVQAGRLSRVELEVRRRAAFRRAADGAAGK